MAGSSLGLSMCHISPRGNVSWYPKGQLLVVRRTGYRRRSSRYSSRGRISAFTSPSRSRLLRKCASLDRSDLRRGLFVTLTYPSEWTSDAGQWKRDLDVFWKRIARKFARACALWKLEFQVRGAPHFHLLILGPNFIDALWLRCTWFLTVNSEDYGHLEAGTQVDRVRKSRDAIAYAAKYLGKVSTTDVGDYVGRYWGVLGRKFLPCYPLERRVTGRTACAVVRLLRKVHARTSYARRHSRYRASWRIIDGHLADRIASWAGTLE
jgi:hypothetical protein